MNAEQIKKIIDASNQASLMLVCKITKHYLDEYKKNNAPDEVRELLSAAFLYIIEAMEDTYENVQIIEPKSDEENDFYKTIIEGFTTEYKGEQT